jgi:hypothetical protein
MVSSEAARKASVKEVSRLPGRLKPVVITEDAREAKDMVSSGLQGM